MALTANRHEEPRTLALTVAEDTFGQGVGSATVESWYYDHPMPAFSLLIKEVKQYTDSYGHLAKREEEEWDYDEASRLPRSHSKTIYARVSLPGVTGERGLMKVQDEQTIYILSGWLIGGELSHTTTKGGWVVYDLRPSAKNLTDAEKTVLRAAGICPPGESKKPDQIVDPVELQLVPDSARVWDYAMKTAAIVEKATAPQRVIWRDVIAIEQVWVEDDLQKTITWTMTKDCTKNDPPTITKVERLKAPLAASLPVGMAAPRLKGSAGSDAIVLEIAGGGAEFTYMDKWYQDHTQHVRPEKYGLYRRTVVQAARAASGDVYGIWATPPAYKARTIGPVEEMATTDFSGNPASALPAPIDLHEPENPAPPMPAVWDHVADIHNAEKTEGAEGKAVYRDTAIESGSTYEYYAVAILGTQESPASNHVTVAYVGSQSFTSGIAVRVVTNDDASLEIDAVGPPLPGVPENMGRVVTLTAPVSFDAEASAGWGAGLIADPATFGRESFLRQALRDAPRQHMTVRLTTPLLTIDRGDRVEIPEVLFTTRGNGLAISSRIVPTDYLVDGFAWSIGRDKDGNLTLDPGTLDLIEP